ncbi:hypothetical protein D3C86_1375280 [compost metagenome]
MQHALGHRPVTKKGHGHAASLSRLVRHGAAQGDGDACAHDAVGAQDAQTQVRHVHGSAAPLTQAPLATHDFLHESTHVHAARQHVAVAAMGGRQRVLWQ